MELPRRPVELIAAGLGDHRHLRAGVVAELGRERRRLHADFLHRVGRRRIEAGRLRVVGEVGAVQREVVLPARRAVHDHRRAAARAGHLLGRRHVGDAGQGARQLDDVASVERQLLHAPVVDQTRHRRASGFDQRGRAGDDDRFLKLPQIHPEVHAQVLSGGQLGLGPLRRKPRELRRDLVVASRHREQIEEARFVGDRRPRELLSDHRGLDVGARNDGAALVAHVAADGARDLGGRRRAAAEDGKIRRIAVRFVTVRFAFFLER